MNQKQQEHLKRVQDNISQKQQKIIGDEIEKSWTQAKQLRLEAENLVSQAKEKVERMILGEEDVI